MTLRAFDRLRLLGWQALAAIGGAAGPSVGDGILLEDGSYFLLEDGSYALLEDSWTPAALFAASEEGGWYDPSDFSTLWQDTAGTVAVTATGQTVARIDDKSGNGNHLAQATAAARPTVEVDGSGNYYLNFDGVDDALTSAYPPTATITVDHSIAYVPQAVNFVMFPKSGSLYLGIGQSGSSSTTLAGGATGLVEYWDGVLSTNTTRGQNYTSAQAANVYLGRAAWASLVNIKIGGVITGAAFPGPKRIYQILVREAAMDASQLASWTTYAGNKAGVTL